MSGIQLKNVFKSYEKTEVIRGVNIDIEEGEFCVFVGPSGCGKSTLLRMIAGLEEINNGEIFIDGVQVNEVDPAQRGVAMVFQSYALYPHMNVEENIGFGLKMNKVPKEEIRQRVQKVAEILKLIPYLKRQPKALSGGQRQRVAIGRALVRGPKAFLFDEPLSNLDAELRMEMRTELARLHNQLKTTMIYVTHDQVEAMTLADKIVVLKNGKVEQVGSPMELYQNPDNQFVAGFIGSPAMNFIKAYQHSQDIEIPAFSNQKISMNITPCQEKREVNFGIRPEHLSLIQGNGWTIELIERLGGVSYVYLISQTEERITLEVKGKSEVQEGQRVGVTFSSDHVFLFDQETKKRIR